MERGELSREPSQLHEAEGPLTASRLQKKSLLTCLSVRGHHYDVHQALHVGQHRLLVAAGVFVHPLDGLSLPVSPVDPAVLLRESGERG